MEKFGRILSTEMLTKVVNKLNAVQFQTARERYDYMLKEFPDISQRVPLGHIASYLGMTQETLSRIRRNILPKTRFSLFDIGQRKALLTGDICIRI